MPARRASDWLSAYLQYSDKSEPPRSYHTWVGISLIAGAMQRKCCLEWGFETLYPNFYIILVGPSGRARKGVAIGIGKDLITEVPSVKLVAENITREALIRAMKDATGNYTDRSGAVKFHSSITAMSEELSVFLGQQDIKFLASLTDWYDSKNKWTYETKGTGIDEINGVCFNLLGGTAPDWLQSMLPQEAVGGGFTSRVIFIVEDRKGKTVPKSVLTDDDKRIRQALIDDLTAISNLSGVFKFSAGAEDKYIKWYTDEDEKMQKGIMPVNDPRFNGYCERRATHLRKLMMVLSASRSDSLVIDAVDFDRALMLLAAAELKMYKTFGGLGKSAYGDATQRVMEYIRRLGIVAQSDLMRTFYRDVDPGTLRVVEETLTQMRVISIKRHPETNNVFYEWIGSE